MTDPIDRRRFLALGAAGTAAAVESLSTLPQKVEVAGATPAPTHGPNLVFNDSFGQAAVGEPPIGWTSR